MLTSQGFRLTSEQTVHPIQPWKLVDCGSVVRTYEIFSTRAFGDTSLIFVSDYHPCAKTVAEAHFYAPRFDRHGSQIRTPQNHVTEETLLGYVMQIANAIKAIHSNNLTV